ncbi:protein kinase domain protein [Moelleriella libera RCEF 2490]|uniref:Protein kinase domain protein n=1 Tax=Moelleriella libera RCEF 2490 TaxID=1081109 RepID=A0A166VK53_9HYPO|nr:protein kinase domain protein [Moelleriella libera RCEF 2490]
MGLLPIFEYLMPCEEWTAAMQVELLGKLPPEWWARWERRSKYFAEDGQMLDTNRPVWAWDFHFETAMQEWRRALGMELMSSGGKEALLAMLKPMLRYKPEERCSMTDVLRSKWMNDSAMLDFEKLQKQPLPS